MKKKLSAFFTAFILCLSLLNFSWANEAIELVVPTPPGGAIDYVRGFHNIYSETRFIDYLRDQKWFRDNDACLTSLRFTWSKEYEIGRAHV